MPDPTSNTLLEVKSLSVTFQTEEKLVPAVRDVSFTVKKGEILGLVGESGSGKTVTAMSIVRLFPRPPGRFDSGEILFHGASQKPKDLLKIPVEELRKIRGREISVIFQEPMTALSPLHKVGDQLAEAVRIHNPKVTQKEALDTAAEWLDKVGIPDPRERMKAFPYQFSGGMRQRAMIAMALILQPKLIIADEPTTALDVTLQQQIFELILKMKQEDTSIVFITHDMGVIWELADRVLVMKDSHIVERGEVETLFGNPQEAYTKELLAAVPKLTDPPVGNRQYPEGEAPLIEVKDLKTWFPVKSGIFAHTVGHVKAVDGVSFDIFKNETVGLVGESGSGKTTIGRTLLGLDKSTEGSALYDDKNILNLPFKEMLPFRRKMQMIFQDPFSSLNPRLTILDILTEGLLEHGLLNGKDRKDEAARWLKEVHLDPDYMNRYPHEFSGGQRQRICVARAMAVQPEFVVCDEAVSALDVTIQAKVIDLLVELKEKFGLSYLFISHDLSVVKRICDRVLVLHHGVVVEEGKTEDVVSDPQHPYTKKLISAVPVPGDKSKRARLEIGSGKANGVKSGDSSLPAAPKSEE